MRPSVVVAWALVVASVVAGTAGPPGAERPRPAAAAPAPTRTEASTTTTPAGALRSETLALPGGPAGPARASGSATEVAVTPGTQMVGLSWTGSPTVELEVRGRSDGGPWSDWIDLHADLPDAPAVGRHGVGPVWLGRDGVDTVAVRVADGVPADLALTAMAFTPHPAATPRVVDLPATPAGGPPIRPRTDWAPEGWRSSRPGCGPAPPVMDQLRFAVVHHTVHSNTYAAADVPGLLAGIHRFHTQSNGWCDVAYNFFVDRFGTVWQGRSGSFHDPIGGGHTQGFNTHSVGVALLGQHHPEASPAAAAPSVAALAGVRDLLAWKLAVHDVDPRATVPIVSQGSPRFPSGRLVTLPTIQGHRDTGLTACPGDLTVAQMAQLRQDVADRIAATATPEVWQPASTGLRFFDRIVDQTAGRNMPSNVGAHYTSLVVRDGWDRDLLAHAIVFAPATDARVGMVDRLYQAAFGRLPDADGLAYWVGQYDRGRPVRWFAAAFAESNEFRTRHAHLGNGAYATALYRNVLDRAPDSAGLAYWTGRLDAGMSRAEALALFSESSENVRTTRLRTDVTRAWYGLLLRAPTAAERAHWDQRFAGGATTGDLLHDILGSLEYAIGG